MGWASKLVFGSTVWAMAAMVSPSNAEACGPPAPEQFDPCETLWVYIPAPTFPVGLESQLRVRNDYIDEQGWHSGPSEDVLDLPEPFVIERRTDAGFEDVAFELVDEPDLVGGARHIALEDPQAGDYRVVWSASTCSFEPEAEDGSGRVVSEFSMTPETDHPGALGSLDVRWEVEDVVFHLGESGDCTPIESEATVGTAYIELPFSDAWLPWADSVSIAVYLDGELERGFAQVPTEQALAGTFTTSVQTLCATDDPELDNLFSFGPNSGSHTIELVARVGDFEPVFSDPVEYTVDCGSGPGQTPGEDGDDTDDNDDNDGNDDTDDAGGGGLDDDQSETDDPSLGSGCSVGGPPRTLGWILLIVLAGLRRRRR